MGSRTYSSFFNETGVPLSKQRLPPPTHGELPAELTPFYHRKPPEAREGKVGAGVDTSGGR